MPRHKHDYGISNVTRHPTKRGMVIVTYTCRNRNSYCGQKTKTKVEPADKYQ